MVIINVLIYVSIMANLWQVILILIVFINVLFQDQVMLLHGIIILMEKGNV